MTSRLRADLEFPGKVDPDAPAGDMGSWTIHEGAGVQLTHAISGARLYHASAASLQFGPSPAGALAHWRELTTIS